MKQIRTYIVSTVCALIATLNVYAQRTVTYDLYVNDTIVNYTGKFRKALAINGQIPAPTLYFTEGDTAVIRVHNRLDKPTSIHWHGILLPNIQDGVPFLTTAPVAPQSTHIYTFPIIQNGTYWYHSHAGLQEQEGLYGAFVIHKREDNSIRTPANQIPEYTIVLSDWTNTNAQEVNRRLHTDSDWASIKKKSAQSYWEALRAGQLGTKFKNEWKRMEAMDVSDVYYNCFLLNGATEQSLSKLHAGDKIRLRIVNGGSSTYFWLQYAGGKITVVAADGKDIHPVEVDRMIIAVSETYDIVVTIPENNTSYQLLATAEDRSGSSSLWLGSGKRKSTPPLPKLNYFAGMKMMNKMMKINGDMDNMGMNMSMQKMDMNKVMYPEINDSIKIITLNYDMLKSPVKTNLPTTVPMKELHLELTGSMDRYVWSLNNKTLSEADLIQIKEGENVRMILHNNTMMRHPMHLHGHFFRLRNKQGEYAPMKFTFDILPMETDTIEFNANERSRGDWYFHCHILYHMMSGMGRVFHYEDSPVNPQLPDSAKAIRKVYAMDRKFYFTARNDFAFNGNNGRMESSNTRWGIQAEWQLGYKDKDGYEIETRFGRYTGKKQWLFPYIGVYWNYRKGDEGEKNLFGQRTRHDNQWAGTVGMRYTMPWLIVLDARLDTYGQVRLQLERENIALTSRLRMNLMVNSEVEYAIGLRYILLPYLSVSANYNSEMKFGVGIQCSY
ncbi:multicopper oxidase domain-containing protein [uncultured Bacteroides sp.]|uniref:multicopper oxidase domain-containing protein n=1 Tax=uncultured Bacteroides sp. TaxID=162156 RepID=UPI0025D49272|nr:multicopper oxidase domain-containing protein [uncultured Bacteroides sp.]